MTVLNEFTFLNGVTAPCYSKELLNNAGGGLVLAVSDGFDGSITVQGKQNGEWYTLAVVDLVTASTADAITAAGSYSVNGVAGFSRIRLNLTAVSGTATVSGRLTTEPGTILAASSSESGGGGGGGGSGDFKLCKVTITNNTLQPLAISVPFAVDNEEFNGSTGETLLGPSGSPKSSFDANIIAYKGQAQLSIPFGSDTSMASLSVETTGSVEYDSALSVIFVTGDGTVAFSSK